MIFGTVPVAESVGAILAHSHKVGGRSMKKGRKLSTEDAAQLAAAGIDEVVAARLEPGDVPEDEAAARLAGCLAGTGVRQGGAFTGRVNLFATGTGLLRTARDVVDAVNRVHESLTVATLDGDLVVGEGQLVATVKVIPFAVPGEALEAALAVASTRAVGVLPFAALRAGLVQTRLAGTRDSVLDKTRRVLTERLEALGGALVAERRCHHDARDVAAAIESLEAEGLSPVLVAGASAIVDRRDVVPAGVERAGGRVEYFGMPVDPGNLLLLARVGDTPVVGLPGCARSPRFNGFDRVLQRLAAGVPVSGEIIAGMGCGGLLKEIAERPQPRRARPGAPARAPARAPRVAALVLAAGQSRRMGPINKLLAPVDGVPMVRRTVDALLSCPFSAVHVVTGHERDRVEQALAGSPVLPAHNASFAEGISTSLQTGLAALPEDVEGVLVCLGDMPGVAAPHLERLLAAFDPVEGREICVPTHGGKRGNPVLWGSRFFPEMRQVQGDVGARHLIGEHADYVCEVAMDDDAVLIDLDTREAFEAWTRSRASG